LAAFNSEAHGMPHLPVVILSTPLGLAGDLPPDEVRELTRSVLPDFEAILTTQDLGALEQNYAVHKHLAARVPPTLDPEITIGSDGTVPIDTDGAGDVFVHLPPEPEELMEYLGSRRAYDGLPVVPPTPGRVDRMLEYSLYDPDEEILHVTPRRGVLTPRRLAACAVMAGCKPEYYPVLETAFSAMRVREFNLGGMTTTTGEVWPTIIVSGPYAKTIGMESGFGLFGPGNRANMTIGRTITLVLFAVGGAFPGAGSYATFGNMTRRGLAFAEDLETPWTPYHVEMGYPDQTTVTVTPTTNPSYMVDESESADNVLYLTARHIATPGTLGDYNPGPVFVIFNPSHRQRLAQAGYTKELIRQFLYENARQPYKLISIMGAQIGRKRWPKWVYANPHDGMVPFLSCPEDARILSAGGPVAADTAILRTWWGNSEPQTVPLRLP
jgi:hypothetical protein